MRSRLRPGSLCLLFLGGCAQLPARPELPTESGIAVAAEDTVLDRRAGELESRNPAASAFRLVSEGPEAFAIRAHSADLAGRSIDVQTYIWHADVTGLYLAHRLLEAADRGVSVRLLLDDMDARAKSAGLAALDAHPDIRIRVFNPFATRRGILRQLGELVGSFG
ncbi:MAG TPA: phospholipase D family protein, partial [Woeseiaceae bacterium]|nr:phospholipase D family protein [Woeseiaceae bacterium]